MIIIIKAEALDKPIALGDQESASALKFPSFPQSNLIAFPRILLRFLHSRGTCSYEKERGKEIGVAIWDVSVYSKGRRK